MYPLGGLFFRFSNLQTAHVRGLWKLTVKFLKLKKRRFIFQTVRLFRKTPNLGKTALQMNHFEWYTSYTIGCSSSRGWFKFRKQFGRTCRAYESSRSIGHSGWNSWYYLVGEICLGAGQLGKVFELFELTGENSQNDSRRMLVFLFDSGQVCYSTPRNS